MSSKISLIINREYQQRVRKKSFIITTILMPVLMAALMIVPSLLMIYSTDEQREVIVVDKSGQIAERLVDNKTVTFKISTSDETQTAKENPEAYGFLIIGENIITDPSQLTLRTTESSTIGLEKEITSQVSEIIENHRIAATEIAGLDSIMQGVRAHATLSTYTVSSGSPETEAKSSSSVMSMGLGYIGGFMIYMFVFLYGNFVMQGVIEEKSNKIIEVMISSVKPFELMMGKILGIALVALTQIVIWIVVFIGLAFVVQGLIPGGAEGLAAQTGDAQMSAAITSITDIGYMVGILGWYLLFFVGGYLLYAAMFAAVGSAVDNIQDAQTLQLPITIPLILALLVMMSAISSPNGAVAVWFSMIPFTSPIVMMARIPYGVPVWEILASLILLYGSFIGMTWVSGKIYRVGIFMTGKKPSLKEFIKWARYKN